MPYSAPECKTWIVDKIVGLQPRRVLDVGAGSGTYSTLLRPGLPGAWFTAIEVFGPYLHRYSLDEKYDEIVNMDFLQIASQLKLEPRWDVVIMGDVLEHFAPDDAAEAYDLARTLGRHVVVATPIQPWPQGEVDGNQHEAHLTEFTFDELKALPGVTDSTSEGVIGAIFADGHGGRDDDPDASSHAA